MRFAIKGGLYFLFLALSKGIDIGVRGGGAVGAAAPTAWKISGQALFSGQAQVAQKSWMTKIFQYSEKF